MPVPPSISVVIRTLNEAQHLETVLSAVKSQVGVLSQTEVVVVDSGSTDATLDIASRFGCRIVHISRTEFTFGRSLNLGCEAASGDYLVFLSGHCIPAGDEWLASLTSPLGSASTPYSYGRQIGGESSRFSECQLFEKYFPPKSRVPQEGFFCNNANAALRRDAWKMFRFNEELTGLEDMELAQRLVMNGGAVAYVAEASVLHLHDESWTQVRNRYTREALALQSIMPQIHISFFDFLRYTGSAVFHDAVEAFRERRLTRVAHEILLFRMMQYWGSYSGNNDHRKLSRVAKERYFYPR